MPDKQSLLPRGSTPLEFAIEQASARIEDVPVLIATLWDVDACDVRWLGWLAWSLSVDVWDADWDEATKREVIRQAVPIHRRKGTIGAVRRALATLGITVDISEWFEHGGAPHTFRLDAYAANIFDAGLAVNPKLLDMIARVIESVKPVRSQMERLRIGERFGSDVYLRAGGRHRYVQRDMIDPAPPVQTVSAPIYIRTASRSRIISRHVHTIIRKAA
jgi:phage tail P2-like protein